MAFKYSLISFKFDQVDQLVFDPESNFSFKNGNPEELHLWVQPVVRRAFKLIRRCVAATISSSLKYGFKRLINVNNFMHSGHVMFDANLVAGIDEPPSTSVAFYARFFKLDPTTSYKVLLEIEEIPSTAFTDFEMFDEWGFTNDQINNLVKKLDESFSLGGEIEFTPIIKRGLEPIPRFLVSSDNRVMEYDFDKVLYHKKNEFQDIKIVSSPSLGNTLLLDNLQNLSEADISYTHTLMDKGNISYKDKEILILGGGDGGILYELLLESPKMVTMAELDPDVMEACREHIKPWGQALNQLEGPNHKIIVGDCLEVLRDSLRNGKKYDYIFNDLTDIPVTKRPELLTAFDSRATQPDSPWGFIEVILSLSLDCLTDTGLYMNHATGKGNLKSIEAYEEFLRKLKTPVEFTKRSSYVPSFMEIWVFYTVSKRALAK